jgi:integration host factor subunit alpha
VARRIQSWIERINVALTKADLVDSIHEKIGFSKKEAADMVELIFDTMKAELNGSGGKIKISGFGNFVVREKRSRTGRNPQTGQSIEISARRVLTFKPSQVLRAEVNETLKGKEITPDMIRRRAGKDDEDEE